MRGSGKTEWWPDLPLKGTRTVPPAAYSQRNWETYCSPVGFIKKNINPTGVTPWQWSSGYSEFHYYYPGSRSWHVAWPSSLWVVLGYAEQVVDGAVAEGQRREGPGRVRQRRRLRSQLERRRRQRGGRQRRRRRRRLLRGAGAPDALAGAATGGRRQRQRQRQQRQSGGARRALSHHLDPDYALTLTSRLTSSPPPTPQRKDSTWWQFKIFISAAVYAYLPLPPSPTPPPASDASTHSLTHRAFPTRKCGQKKRNSDWKEEEEEDRVSLPSFLLPILSGAGLILLVFLPRNEEEEEEEEEEKEERKSKSRKAPRSVWARGRGGREPGRKKESLPQW